MEPPRTDPTAPTATTHVLLNAEVRTMDPADTRAEALAWRDGRILAVGARADVERLAGTGARVTDLAGAAVLPGFIDPHHHPAIVALYGGVLRLAAPRVTDIPSLQRALAEAAATLPPGRWLVATAWDEGALAERRPPTRRELDDAVPDRPLFALHWSCHRALANSAALALAGIDAHTADPAGGAISRARHGEPDGLLIERGMSRVECRARASLAAHDVEGFLLRMGEHHRALLAAGITRVVDATVPGDLAALYREAARRGVLRVPTVMLPVSVSGYLDAPWDVLEAGRDAGADTEVLSSGPVKLVFDGAPGCAMCLGWWQTAGVFVRTCALALRDGSLDPVRATLSVQPRLGAKLRTGIQIYARDEAHKVVGAALERGFGTAIHAIGNAAVDVALGAYEAAGAALAKHGIPRIEHAEFLDRELVARIAGVGAAVVAQPYFVTLPPFAVAPSIPGLRTMPLRWLLDAGARVAASSDHPVAGFDPLDGVRAAVSRRTARDRVYEPDQRVTLDEALAMYTRTAAEVTGCADRCGTLAAGKRADLVVLTGPLGTEAQLADARVRTTVLGGDVVSGAALGG